MGGTVAIEDRPRSGSQPSGEDGYRYDLGRRAPVQVALTFAQGLSGSMPVCPRTRGVPLSALSPVPPRASAPAASDPGLLRLLLASAAAALAAAVALPVASAGPAGTGLAPGADLPGLLVLAVLLWPLATASVVVGLVLVLRVLGVPSGGPVAPVELPATLLGALVSAVPVALAVPVLERVLGLPAAPVPARAAGAVLPAALALVVALLAPRPALAALRGRRAVLLLTASAVGALEPAVAAATVALPAPFAAGTTADRTYDVVALDVAIPFNR